MRILFIIAAFSSCATFGCSNEQRPTRTQAQPPVQASIKGRVFLITAGGDLKPARLPNVYLLAADESLNQDSAKILQAALQHCLQLEQIQRALRDFDFSQSLVNGARGEFAKYQSDLSALEMLFRVHSVLTGQTDEDGQFTFEKVPSGSYAIAAFGQAGVNLAYWGEPLQVKAGEQSEIKLSQPVTACSGIL